LNYSSTLSISPVGGVISPAVTVFVRVAASAPVGAVSGSVVATSPGVTPQTVSLSGQVNESPLALVPAGLLPPFNIPVAAFFIAKNEVTVEEWNAVRNGATAIGYLDLPLASGAATEPVRNISWYAAAKWLNAKSEIEGLDPVYWQTDTVVYRNGLFQNWVPEIRVGNNGYRMPRDNEWEWAARGADATSTTLYSGSNDLNAVGWYNLNSGGTVQPVRGKLPNALGVYDMSGNVNEWCLNPVDFTAARFRGGAFDSVPKQCEVSFKSFQQYSTLAAPNAGYPNIGLRYARNPGGGAPVVAFNITVNGTPVRVERRGTGTRGIIFFSSWAGGNTANELPARLRQDPDFPFTQQLDTGNYSMFFWSYPPSTPPFPTQVNTALSTWQGGNFGTRLTFPGMAKSVVDQILANSPDITGEVCVVGNSLGAGIILQGYNDLLLTNPKVRFVLVAPTEVFLPALPTLPPLLQRTLIASDPANDFYFRTTADINYITANSQISNGTSPNWPLGYVPGSSWAHWIIPDGGAPMVPFVFDLVGRALSLP